MGVKAATIKGGGEPLMHSHIDELLHNLKSAGVRSGVITNGELLDQHIASISDCCDWVRVSLDAATAGTHAKLHRPAARDSFDRIKKGIMALPKHVFTGVNMVVHPGNLDEMFELGKKAKAWGADYAAYKKVIIDRECFGEDQLNAM